MSAKKRAEVRTLKEGCRMKRSLLTATGITALALAVPGAALAHHGHGRHHRHGAKAHAHHAKFRFVHIGATAGTPAVSPTTTTPTTPTTPTPPPGKVTSYTGGVLTLTLNDGSTVSGKVTNETRIECVKATPTTTPPTGTPDQGPGDDSGAGDDQSRGDMSRQGDQGSGEGQQGDDEGDDDGPPVSTEPEPPCDSSALVAGAVVRAAELRIGPGGTEFESVLLVR
jgi:hypothetical protein